MAKVVVVYSGGMDSRTVLQAAVDNGHEVHTISMYYGQRHAIELNRAMKVTSELGIPYLEIDLSFMNDLGSSSSLIDLDKEVPHGHYEAESMKDTVVPNRNMLLLSVAIAHAVNIKASEVWYGAHGGDHAIYPDCRPEFLDRMNEVSLIANWNSVLIRAPFMPADKAKILSYGLEHGVDYKDTWTCYDPQSETLGEILACGKCGSCQERLEAFEFNGVTDPLEYVK